MAADPAPGAAGTYYVPFPILALASNGDDIFLTAGGGGSTNVKENPNVVHAHRYSEETRKLSTIATLSTGASLVHNLTYSPVTKLWLASSRAKCKILSLDMEANELKEVCEFATESEGKEPEQNFASCSPDGSLIVTGGTDGLVKIWKALPDGKEPTLQRTCGKKSKEIEAGAISHDSKYVAACDRTGNCRLWTIADEDAEDGKVIEFNAKQAGGKALIKSVHFLPSSDGSCRLLLGANGSQRKMMASVVGIFGLDGSQLASILIDKGPLKSVSMANDDQRFVVGLMEGRKVNCEVTNIDTPSKIGLKMVQKTKVVHSLPAQAVAFTGKKTAISVSGDRDIHLLEVTGTSFFSFERIVQYILFLIVFVYIMSRIGVLTASSSSGVQFNIGD